jgi:hypothetical protein
MPAEIPAVLLFFVPACHASNMNFEQQDKFELANCEELR